MAKLIFDIGGTNVKYAYVDGPIFKVDQFSVVGADGVERLPLAINKFMEQYRYIDEIGVSAPGPFDFKKGIGLMKHKLTSIYQVSLLDLFKKCAPKAKVTFIHDAVAFTLGVLTEFPLYLKKNVCVVMLGTGLGYAYAEEGKVHVDKNEITTPEFGFIPYKDGMIENYVSATALLRIAKDAGYDFKGVKEMAEVAKDGKSDVLKIFYDVGKTLGEVLKKQNEFDKFEHVFIGGGASLAWHFLKPGFEAACNFSYSIVKDPFITPLKGVLLALKLGKDNIYIID